MRITTNLVQVDLVVTKDGKHVTNLKPEDFEILEDGRAQKITSFAYVSTSAAASTASSNTESTVAPSIPKPLLPYEVRRTIAIVVDDLGMSFESMANLRTYLRKFLSENVRSNDLIAIIRTGGEVGALQQFTSDQRALSGAIADLKWNPCSRVGAGVIAPERSLVLFYPPEKQWLGRNPDKLPSGGQVNSPSLGKESNWCSIGSSVSYTIGALRFILRGMRDLPGRKSMMVISDSLPLQAQDLKTADFGFKRPVREDFENIIDVWTQTTNYQEKLFSLGEMAIRASVVIYGVSSQKLQTTGIQPADEVSFPPPDSRTVGPKSDTQDVAMKLLRARSTELTRNTDALEMLAKETGGLVIRNKNEFDFERVFEDQNGYYLIGYRPESATFDRRFHTIKARVKRDGLTVRTRSGFYGVEENRGSAQPSDLINSALASPFSKNEIEVRVATLFANDPARGSLLRVFLTVDANRLTFALEPDGTHVAKLDLSTVLFGENGSVAKRQDQNATLRLRGKPYERALRDGVFYGFDLPVKHAGAFQLRVALRDTASQRIGASGQFVHVPYLGNGELALSGLVVQADQADDQGSNLVLKRFHQGTSLAFGYTIYNAALEKKTLQPKLKTTTLVFRDGVKIYSSEPAVVETTGQKDLQRIFTGARLQLGPALTPGEYALQIVVEDQIGKRSTTQWTQFEVIR